MVRAIQVEIFVLLIMLFRQMLAALTDNIQNHSIYNIAFGAQTSLEDLFYLIRETLTDSGIEIVQEEPLYREYRDGMLNILWLY